jgi:hypothetical protein
MELLAIVFYQKVFYLKMKYLLILFILLILLSSCIPTKSLAETSSTDISDTNVTRIMATAEEHLPLTDEELTALLTPNDGEVLLLGQILYVPQQNRVSINIEHAGGKPALYRRLLDKTSR